MRSKAQRYLRHVANVSCSGISTTNAAQQQTFARKARMTRIRRAGCESPGGIPINWTERKWGQVNTTHETATVVRTASYKTRRGSQYRKASATDCLKSFTSQTLSES